jgi:Mg/Co/Ni transporter MgtE
MIRIALLIAAAILLPILVAQLPYSASADSPILAQVATSTDALIPSTTTIAEIEAMTIDVAVDAMDKMTNEQAVHVFNEMNTVKVVEMMGHMDISRVSSIWGDMEPSKAGAVMEDVEVDTASQIVGLVSSERLVERLPEISAPEIVANAA